MDTRKQSEQDGVLYYVLRGREGDDRRRAPRRPYYRQQFLAPYDGKNPPSAEDFRLLCCHDISSGGFSFFSPDRPTFDQLVVALGRAPFVYMIAQVLHARPVEDEPSGNYLVGCRFLRRLESQG